MASRSLDKNKRAIAKNLIETCGLQRAFHAAKQYGWHDIAEEIHDEIDRSNQKFTETRNSPIRH